MRGEIIPDKSAQSRLNLEHYQVPESHSQMDQALNVLGRLGRECKAGHWEALAKERADPCDQCLSVLSQLMCCGGHYQRQKALLHILMGSGTGARVQGRIWEVCEH